MSDTNPEIQKQLDRLGEICCSMLERETSPATADSETPDSETIDSLLKALLMSGFGRKSETTLQAEIENRVKDNCRDSAMHRGGALTSLTADLQKRFDELKSWESRQPDDQNEPKAANISSATDA